MPPQPFPASHPATNGALRMITQMQAMDTAAHPHYLPLLELFQLHILIRVVVAAAAPLALAPRQLRR